MLTVIEYRSRSCFVVGVDIGVVGLPGKWSTETLAAVSYTHLTLPTN